MSHRRLAVLQKAQTASIDEHAHRLHQPATVQSWPFQQHRKRGAVNVTGACSPCRKGKRKCDGSKPVCTACRKRIIDSSHCVYDQLEGFSRSGTLKHNLQSLKDEQESLRSFVKDLLHIVPGTSVKQCLSEHEDPMLARALGKKTKQELESMALPPSDQVDHDAEEDVRNIHMSPLPISSKLTSPEQQSPKNIFRSPSYGTAPSSSVLRSSVGEASSPRDTDLKGLDLASLRTSNSSPYPTRITSPSFSRNNSEYSQKSAEDQTRPGRMFLLYQPNRTHQSENTHTVRIYGHLPASCTDLIYGAGQPVPQGQVVDMEVPLYMIQPMTLPECSSPLSEAIVAFLHLARERIARGWPIESILGPIRFDVSQLLEDSNGYNPNYDDFSAPGWAISAMLTFPSVDILHRLTAALHYSRLMRWLIAPDAANYALLHENQRPTPTQRLMPHIAEYDFVTLPSMRDALITRPREYYEACTHLHSLWDDNVPYTVADPLTNSITLTTEFEEFVGIEANWAIGTEILDTFPEFEGKPKIWTSIPR